MSDLAAQRVYWTVADLDLLPDTWDGTRHEIIDGELFASKSPHWDHQEVCGNLYQELRMWSQASGLGRAGLAPGVLFSNNELRDRQAKLKVYSMYGVQEYWIVDWQLQQVTIYRREQGMLRLALTLLAGDELSSPLLPGFACPLARLFT
jgi:Uma2 family endonuclease